MGFWIGWSHFEYLSLLHFGLSKQVEKIICKKWCKLPVIVTEMISFWGHIRHFYCSAVCHIRCGHMDNSSSFPFCVHIQYRSITTNAYKIINMIFFFPKKCLFSEDVLALSQNQCWFSECITQLSNSQVGKHFLRTHVSDIQHSYTAHLYKVIRPFTHTWIYKPCGKETNVSE